MAAGGAHGARSGGSCRAVLPYTLNRYPKTLSARLSVMYAMSAMYRLELMGAPDAATTAERSTSVSTTMPRSACRRAASALWFRV